MIKSYTVESTFKKIAVFLYPDKVETYDGRKWDTYLPENVPMDLQNAVFTSLYDDLP